MTIILVIAAAAIGFLIGFLIKKKKLIDSDMTALEKYNNQIKEAQEKVNSINYKIENAQKEFNKIQNQTNIAIKNFDELENYLKKQKDIEVKEYYDNEIEKVKLKIQKYDEESFQKYTNNKQAYEKEIEKVKEKLQSLKSAREAIINEQKRQEEIQNKQYFYMLNISEQDKEDISRLRAVESMLHNKEILNKLIWSTYYQTPYKDLVGRLIGTRKISGIYKITCVKNQKAYIGKSVDISERFLQHIKASLEIGNIAKNQLYTLMKKEGAENFTFEILEEVPKEKLLERESYWINFYETDSYGLNMKG